MALVNSTSSGMTATLEAWKAGKMVAYPVRVEVAPHAKYVNLSSGIWPGVGYDGIDTLIVRSNRSIASPIDITGNTAGDRHLFFAAQSEPVNGTAGDLLPNDNTGPYYCDFDAMGYRLPTEGEWEYFARAGTSTSFWVDEPAYGFPDCTADATPGQYPVLESAGWFKADSADRTHPAELKAANDWGIRDVIGNVAEWCWDWHAAYPTTGQVNYRGPNSGTNRVLRSGGFDCRAMSCRSASRASAVPEAYFSRTGFRLVRTLP